MAEKRGITPVEEVVIDERGIGGNRVDNPEAKPMMMVTEDLDSFYKFVASDTFSSLPDNGRVNYLTQRRRNFFTTATRLETLALERGSGQTGQDHLDWLIAVSANYRRAGLYILRRQVKMKNPNKSQQELEDIYREEEVRLNLARVYDSNKRKGRQRPSKNRKGRQTRSRDNSRSFGNLDGVGPGSSAPLPLVSGGDALFEMPIPDGFQKKVDSFGLTPSDPGEQIFELSCSTYESSLDAYTWFPKLVVDGLSLEEQLGVPQEGGGGDLFKQLGDVVPSTSVEGFECSRTYGDDSLERIFFESDNNPYGTLLDFSGLDNKGGD